MMDVPMMSAAEWREPFYLDDPEIVKKEDVLKRAQDVREFVVRNNDDDPVPSYTKAIKCVQVWTSKPMNYDLGWQVHLACSQILEYIAIKSQFSPEKPVLQRSVTLALGTNVTEQQLAAISQLNFYASMPPIFHRLETVRLANILGVTIIEKTWSLDLIASIKKTTSITEILDIFRRTINSTFSEKNNILKKCLYATARCTAIEAFRSSDDTKVTIRTNTDEVMEIPRIPGENEPLFNMLLARYHSVCPNSSPTSLKEALERIPKELRGDGYYHYRYKLSFLPGMEGDPIGIYKSWERNCPSSQLYKHRINDIRMLAYEQRFEHDIYFHDLRKYFQLKPESTREVLREDYALALMKRKQYAEAKEQVEILIEGDFFQVNNYHKLREEIENILHPPRIRRISIREGKKTS